MKIFLVLLCFCGFSTAAFAADNRGQSAMDCVAVSAGAEQPQGVEVVFTNNCDEQIFMIWCGDLQFSEDKCGDGPDGHYYTHSDNIEPGMSNEIRLKSGGSYQFASCYGGISFGNSGEYTDEPDGSFTCHATGSYREDSAEQESEEKEQ